MRKIIIFSLLIASISFAKTTLIEVDGGTTYEIKEKNAIELIKEYVKKNKKRIEKRLHKEMVEAKKKLHNYRPETLTLSLLRAKKDRIFYVDATYALTFDIKDQQGNVIYPKGYKFNPLHYIALRKKYVFFNPIYKEVGQLRSDMNVKVVDLI